MKHTLSTLALLHGSEYGPRAGQGSFAAALLEEDGGIQDAAPAANFGGLFADEASTAGPPAPSVGELSSLLAATSTVGSSLYTDLFTEVLWAIPPATPLHA